MEKSRLKKLEQQAPDPPEETIIFLPPGLGEGDKLIKIVDVEGNIRYLSEEEYKLQYGNNVSDADIKIDLDANQGYR